MSCSDCLPSVSDFEACARSCSISSVFCVKSVLSFSSSPLAFSMSDSEVASLVFRSSISALLDAFRSLSSLSCFSLASRASPRSRVVDSKVCTMPSVDSRATDRSRFSVSVCDLSFSTSSCLSFNSDSIRGNSLSNEKNSSVSSCGEDFVASAESSPVFEGALSPSF